MYVQQALLPTVLSLQPPPILFFIIILNNQNIETNSYKLIQPRWTLFSEKLLILGQILKCSIESPSNIPILDSGTRQAFFRYSSTSSLLRDYSRRSIQNIY